MYKVKRAENLNEAFKNFRADPLLTEEEFRVFYVKRELMAMKMLSADLKNSESRDKFLMVGYRGSGKSTELRRLYLEMEKEGDFQPVLLDIERDLKFAVNDLEIAELLAYVSLKLAEVSEEKGVKVDEHIKEELEDFVLNPIQDVAKEKTKSFSFGIKLISVEASVRNVLRKQFVERSIALVSLIDKLVEDIERGMNKPLVLFLDGTDKMAIEKAENLFTSQIQYLVMPVVRLVLLCPVAIIRHKVLGPTVSANFTNKYEIAQFAVWKKSVNFIKQDYTEVVNEILNTLEFQKIDDVLGSENNFNEAGFGKFLEYKGFRFYYEVAKKRMDLNLIEPQALTKLIIGTGKLSEFIAATRNAISIARAESDSKVKLAHVESALVEQRTLYEDSLSIDDMKLILDVHQKKDTFHKDEEFSRSRNLLYLNHIIRVHAGNNDFWDEADPLFFPLMKKWKKQTKS